MIDNITSQNHWSNHPGSSFNKHKQYQELSSNISITDANSSFQRQKQLNQSRFGGFRTADGSSKP
jgi:hypothetical protein